MGALRSRFILRTGDAGVNEGWSCESRLTPDEKIFNHQEGHEGRIECIGSLLRESVTFGKALTSKLYP